MSRLPRVAAPSRSPPQAGFVLILTILMLLGLSTLAVGMVFNAHHGRVTALNFKNRLRAFYAADGMRTLLAQEVVDGNVQDYLDTSLAGDISGDIWNGANSLAALRSALGRNPDRKGVKAHYLGSNWRMKADYGVRWRGYIIPPISGSYTFLVRADDEGAFYLSSDESPANLSRSPIAMVQSSMFSWSSQGTAASDPVALQIGKRYYFEFLHAQSGGLGFGQVGWQGPNFMVERPIPGKRLAAYGSKSERWDTTKVGRGRVKYSVNEAGPLVYVVNTEAFMGGKGDTTFHSPLAQTLSLRGSTAAPPATLWQHVIYYDYHSDGSNPEFERGYDFTHNGGVTPGLVQPNGLRYTTQNADYFGLDSIGKPLRGAAAKFTCGVEKWFTPWQPGWFKTYKYAGGGSDCTESPNGTDRAFANVVIKDSIQFVQRKDLGVNAYQFKRFAASGQDAAFMPLDGRGFGNEVKDRYGALRNYSFCMELHTRFEHTSGMSFTFNGDDDVWLYINDSLVMDLGYVHGSTSANVSLDDLPLTFGQTYPLDFFFCERQSTGSSIDLITNLPVLMREGKPTSNWKRDYGNIE